MSHPFFGAKFTFTQPNGEKLKVRGWGDQSNARFETLDGYTVVRNPANGYYEIAAPTGDGRLEASGHRAGVARTALGGIQPGLRAGPAHSPLQFHSSALARKTRWQQRIEQAKAALRARAVAAGPVPAPPQRQTVGTFVGLCLPIQFPDVPTDLTPAQISDFCNKPEYNDFGNNGSVRDYYLANSIGKCDYSTVVPPIYTANHQRDHYTDPSVPYGQRAQELIQE